MGQLWLPGLGVWVSHRNAVVPWIGVRVVCQCVRQETFGKRGMRDCGVVWHKFRASGGVAVKPVGPGELRSQNKSATLDKVGS